MGKRITGGSITKKPSGSNKSYRPAVRAGLHLSKKQSRSAKK